MLKVSLFLAHMNEPLQSTRSRKTVGSEHLSDKHIDTRTLILSKESYKWVRLIPLRLSRIS